MTFRQSSLIQKALLNSLTDDIDLDISQTEVEQPNMFNLNSLQLNSEQALQLGLKLFDNGEENAITTISSVQDPPLSSSQAQSTNYEDMNSIANTNATKVNQSLVQFVYKSVDNNSSLLSQEIQTKPKSTIDEVSELLSFNNDEEGSIYLQNSSLNTKDGENSRTNKIVSTKVPRSINSASVSKPIKYTLINQPIKSNVIVKPNSSIIFPNNQSLSLLKDNILNTKSNHALQTLKTKTPVTLLPVKRPKQFRSILIKPQSVLTSSPNNQKLLQPSQVNTILNKETILSKNNVNKANDKKTTVIKHNGIRKPVQVTKTNNVQNSNIDGYKIEYRLDLVNNSNSNNNDCLKNVKYALNVVNENQAGSSTDSTKNMVLDLDLLNKTVPVNSKLEDSIVPLANKKKTNSESEAGVVQKVMQRYTVNTSKPLGSTENPIKLLQRGQTFQSLHSLNESQLQQIAGALKQRPPYQQSGYREPHKVVLYDSETRTRIIYRIVYPDELNLKPAPDAESDSNTMAKEKRKRKAKSGQEVPNGPQDNQQLPRTRTGRVIRPPNRMIHDFKKLRRSGDDSDKDEWVDAEEIQELSIQHNNLTNDNKQCNGNGINSQDDNALLNSATNSGNILENATMQMSNLDQNSSTNLFNSELPRKKKKLNSKFRCPTCDKYYLGYGKMSKHLQKYPDHGEIDKLGIEPKPSIAPKASRMKRRNNKLCHVNSNTDLPSSITSEDTVLSNDGSEICKKSLFECLLEKISSKDCSDEKWQKLNNEVKKFLQSVEFFLKNEVLQDISREVEPDNNKKEKNIVELDDTLSRLVQLKPGHYQLRDTFINSNNTEETTEQKISSPNNLNKLLENTISSMQENKSNLSNSSIDLEMLCSAESEFEKNVMIDNSTNKPTTLQQHMDMLIENEQNIAQSQHISSNNISLSNNNSNMGNTSANLNSVHNIVSYQNVDDLVQESLKNLTADEIASVPNMGPSRNGLDVSHTSLQDLSLDLFQFHHS